MNRIDESANRMAAQMERGRREQDAVLLCATCDNEAAPRSCYCDGCERREFSEGGDA